MTIAYGCRHLRALLESIPKQTILLDGRERGRMEIDLVGALQPDLAAGNGSPDLGRTPIVREDPEEIGHVEEERARRPECTPSARERRGSFIPREQVREGIVDGGDEIERRERA